MEIASRIYIAGHHGMVGSAFLRKLQQQKYQNLILRSRQELDLRNQAAVESFFRKEQPEYVLLAAAKVGGIQANQLYPADFLYDNLMIQTNVLHQAYSTGVKKLLQVGSSCVYPRECPQPMKEEYLLTGPLEPTNEAYAVAKIAGLKMAYFYAVQYGVRFISLMASNLYGPGDSFDPESSHVLSALVKKFVDAVEEGRKTVTIWGTGHARREFLHVDDLAEAVLLVMDRWESPSILNVGSGTDISIKELAELIADRVGFRGDLFWDGTKPDGMPRKLLDISKITALGFQPKITLTEGIEQVIREYRLYHRRDH